MIVRLETDDGAVARFADGRMLPAEGPADRTVAVGSGLIRPGLINAHDHLHRNHYPRLGTPPYPDSYAWGDDLHASHADAIARAQTVPRRDALLFGALKNLIAGVTTVVHHDRWEPDFDLDFPIRVPSLRTVHSLGTERARLERAARRWTTPMCVHVAEGVTDGAAHEVVVLEELGLLDRRLLAVHLVGVDRDGVRRLEAGGVGAVWCPTSNDFLFGRTAPAALFAANLDVLLGSDALLTGEGTLLDELAAARRLGYLDDDRLLAAVGPVAARRLGLDTPTLEPGAPADFALFRRPPLEADARDVALVVVGGKPAFGDECFAPLFEESGVPTQSLLVKGTRRLVAAPLGRVASCMAALTPDCGRIFA